MAKFNKDTQARIDAVAAEKDLQQSLADVLKKNLDYRTKQGKIAKQLTADLANENDLSSKLTKVLEEKQKIIEGEYNLTKDRKEEILKELEATEDLLKFEQQRKKQQQEITDLAGELGDGLLKSVGLSSDMLKNGVMFGVGLAVANKGVEMLTQGFQATVGLAKELYTQLGLSAAESARMGAVTLGNLFTMEGMLYGGEALATAAKDAAEYFGSTENFTAEMQRDLVEISALSGETGTNAVMLQQAFADSGGSASDITDNIKVLAQKEGVSARAIFQDMAKNATILVGKSEEQIMAFAKQSAQLKQMGMTMEDMAAVSDSMLNIEDSLQKEMKARALGMGDLLTNTNAIRAASLEYQMTGDITEFNKAMADLGISLADLGDKGPMELEALAGAYGMTGQQLTAAVTKQEELSKLRKEGLDEAAIKAIQEENEEREANKKIIMEQSQAMFTSYLPAIAQASIAFKALGIGKGMKKLGGLLGMGKKGPDTSKLTGPVKDATDKVKTPDPKKSKGVKGFLTGLKEGLQEFAKGAVKTLLGAVVLAGVVAILGAGFAGAMMILGDVDPVGMLAFSVSIGILGAALALMGAIGGNVIMGALALGIVAIALIPAAYAFSLLENVDIGKMIAFSIMLPLLALAAAGLGFIAPFVMLGAAALMVLGLAIIPAAMAFSMLSDANMEGIVDKLATLGQVAGPLLMVGAGLVSIAAGLAMMGYMGMGALPILGMMLALSAAAPALLALGSMFGLGGGGDDSGVEEKDPINYDKLATALASQPLQVVVDGKVVSEISRMQNVRQSKKY